VRIRGHLETAVKTQEVGERIRQHLRVRENTLRIKVNQKEAGKRIRSHMQLTSESTRELGYVRSKNDDKNESTRLVRG